MFLRWLPRNVTPKQLMFIFVLLILASREAFYSWDCKTYRSWHSRITYMDDAVARQRENSLRFGEDTPSHASAIPFRYIFNASSEPPFPIGPDHVSVRHGDRYLIYRCDDITLRVCGGWADRIKGVMTAYMLANLTGRVFKMEMPMESCDILDFIVPNQVDWYLPHSFHTKVKKGRGVAIMLRADVSHKFLNDTNEDYRSIPELKSQHKYVYYKGNYDYTVRFQASIRYRKQLAWMTNLNPAQMNDAIYRRLFNPSSYLLSKVKSFFSQNLQPHEKLVCAHVRMARNPTIPNDSEIRMDEKYLPGVWELLQKESENTNGRIFLMSDSKNIIKRAKRLFGSKIFFSPGSTILHIDKSSNATAEEKCEGVEKVLFEQLVLMHCDVLLISVSGLGRMAAYVRGIDEGLYCMFDAGTIIPCKPKQLRELYGKYI